MLENLTSPSDEVSADINPGPLEAMIPLLLILDAPTAEAGPGHLSRGRFAATPSRTAQKQFHRAVILISQSFPASFDFPARET
jgi:hypothetical protein